MAEIVRRRSWGGVLPLGRHASIIGSSLIHCAFVSIAPSLFQERQNARIQKRFKLEQALVSTAKTEGDCRKWLAGLMRSGASPRPKDDLWREARDRCSVSRRAFDRSWSAAITESGSHHWS